MRPDARIAAAIDILDDILAGEPAERCLTTWGRRNRYAGSGDRAAIRDLVYNVLRQKRSSAWTGGGESGRALVIGLLLNHGNDPADVFTGARYGPSPLTADERGGGRDLADAPDAVRLDCPDWVLARLNGDFGADANQILNVLRTRAPVFVRVNAARTTPDAAISALQKDGIGAVAHRLASTALEVIENSRRLKTSDAYLAGLVELQDAASQAVVEACVAHLSGTRVLDYCAGGGGKALAFAGAGMAEIVAHDADVTRMSDIPERATRAGASIEVRPEVTGTFDLVMCDAPCSGSGAWRRQPEAKWALTGARLTALHRLQVDILNEAKGHVAPDGILAYATCSLLSAENDRSVDRFLEEMNGWQCFYRHQWTPLDGGDGFYLALMRRS